MSDNRLFQFHLSSDVLPIPMRRSHTWTVQVCDQGGGSVYGASAEISYAASEHHDKPPTQPRVAATDDPGIYKINGVCFSKTGRWVLRLAVQAADGRSDTVTFNVFL